MIDETLEISIEVNCDLDYLFDVFTNLEHINNWSSEECTFDNFVNGNVELFSGWVKGRIIEFNHNESVTFTWNPEDWEVGINSIVKYKFEKSGKLSKFTIIHSNFPDITEKESHYDGWYDYVINPAMNYLLEIHHRDSYLDY